jgi:hypothetical protein
MRFPKFITFKEGEHVFILQSAFPNYVGKLWKCETDWDLYQIKKELQAQVQGYRMMVTFVGTLEGNLVYLGDKKQQLQSLMNEMAFWYFMNRIDKDQKRYAKYKL